MNQTRVLVADSLRIFRTGVHELLTRERDFDVVEAATLEDIEAAVRDRFPDVALIDLELPPSGGVAAVRTLSERCSAFLIVWSFHPTRESVLDAVRSGAHGFLRKQISPDGLVRALDGLAQGEAPLSRDLMAVLIGALHGAGQRERATMLSAREREVLELVACGARNRDIAAALTISEFTVKRHVQNILHKLELPSRRAAATFHRTAFGVEETPLAAAQPG